MYFVAVMMNAAQSGRKKSLATTLITRDISHHFKHSITQIDHMDHDILRCMPESVFASQLLIAGGKGFEHTKL
jgi:hypothetical protein